MKKRIVLILITSLLAACDSRHVVTEDQVKEINIKDYIPNTVGTTITINSYKPEDGKVGIKHIEKVTNIDSVDRRKRVSNEQCSYFDDKSIDPVCVNGGVEASEKVLMSKAGDMEINTEYLEWQTKSKDFKYWISGTKKKIATPVGNYKDCIEVTEEKIDSNTKFLHYYAKGIGKIQTYMIEGSKKTLVSELTKIEIPKIISTKKDSAYKSEENKNSEVVNESAQKEGTTKQPVTINEPYYNGKYGFEIEIPDDWEGHLSILTEQLGPDKIESYTLVYEFEKGLSSPIVTILKEKNEGDLTETINKNKEQGLYFLDQSPEFLFFFVTPMDPSVEFTKPENEQQLNKLIKIIAEEVPDVMQSFKLKKD
ncbi:hypothetical protein [Bacillus cereus]|uniref:Lipoprotein n=1 Tax=Bacillus cereus TaxID=1396 RepID=A0A162PCU0_BACCE|nr:hypothetical protein [Bacillus cereus]KZD71162.1 hypothetical protein B4088_0892 [Bacillus cereus]